MSIETDAVRENGTAAKATVADCGPESTFSAIVGDALEQWRVVAVLGSRVLAEAIVGGERRSFTLRFVRHRISLAAEKAAAEKAAEPDSTAPDAATADTDAS